MRQVRKHSKNPAGWKLLLQMLHFRTSRSAFGSARCSHNCSRDQVCPGAGNDSGNSRYNQDCLGRCYGCPHGPPESCCQRSGASLTLQFASLTLQVYSWLCHFGWRRVWAAIAVFASFQLSSAQKLVNCEQFAYARCCSTAACLQDGIGRMRWMSYVSSTNLFYLLGSFTLDCAFGDSPLHLPFRL